MLSERVEPALRSFFRADPRGLVAAFLLPGAGNAGAGAEVTIAVRYAEPFDPSFTALPLDLEQELEALLACPVRLLVLNNVPKSRRRRHIERAIGLLEDQAVLFA
ncbi:MAG TPA: hypothetical protein VKZ49_17670 [Polyangiaceae bacterium]|jgi:hypothetical protein|nr:hypothetical protein [Polyangiaceae bacterium]